MDINVTEEQLLKYTTNRFYPEDIFSHLTSQEKEFIISGTFFNEQKKYEKTKTIR